MKKLITALTIIAVLLCGCAKKSDDSVQNAQKAAPRVESIAELAKNLAVIRIESVSAENAVIAKYNIDISKYTVYNAEITQSLDGFTPTGNAQFYCLGTTDEFSDRVNMKKGESYIVDAQPWIYDGKLIYLISPYRIAFARIDTAGRVTERQKDGSYKDYGTLDEYSESYANAVAKLTPDPYDMLNRFGEFIKEIKEKNNDISFYDSMEFEWKPSGESIDKTAKASQKLYDDYCAVAAREGMSADEIKNEIGKLLENV